MRNKTSPSRRYKIVIAGLAVLLGLSLVAVITLASFHATKNPSCEEHVLEVFHECDGCTECLMCLSEFGNYNVFDRCNTLNNIFLCVQQLVYLYTRDYPEQPCRTECHTCTDCLETTEFNELEKLNQTLWESQYSGFFRSPEDQGITEYNSTFDQENGVWLFHFKDNTVEVEDTCCTTTQTNVPYTESSSISGVTWYPVWFYMPNGEVMYEYQWQYDVTCGSPSSSCDPAGLPFTYLMTTTAPNPTYGYTYILLTVPSDNTNFIDFSKPAFCHTLS